MAFRARGASYGATKLCTTAYGIRAASGNQPNRASRAHSETNTMPSTCGITSRSSCRIARYTSPSRAISRLSTHSSAWEIRKCTASATRWCGPCRARSAARAAGGSWAYTTQSPISARDRRSARVRKTSCQWRYHPTPAGLLQSRTGKRQPKTGAARAGDHENGVMIFAGRADLGEVPTKLPSVRVHAGAPLLPEHRRDDERDRIRVRPHADREP